MPTQIQLKPVKMVEIEPESDVRVGVSAGTAAVELAPGRAGPEDVNRAQHRIASTKQHEVSLSTK